MLRRKRSVLVIFSLFIVIVLMASCTQPGVPPEEPMDEVSEPIQLLNPEVVADNGIVAAAHPLAAQVGAEIIQQGGNAIDAAVATAFTLGVVEPNASGLGGGGFMVIRFADTGETTIIDYREVAPLAATEDMYELDADGKVIDFANSRGYRAVAVPGQVAGLSLALEKYGTMDLAQVTEKAIHYAENGFEVSEGLSSIITDNFDKINAYPATAEIYLKDGLPLEPGDTLINTDLANSLRLIAEEGPDAFYKGPIGEAIAANMAANGGLITMDDFAAYKPAVRKPVSGEYRGYEIVSMPPPSSGGTHIIQILNILEGLELDKMEHNSAEHIHYMAEAMKRAFADRGVYMADPDFADIPLDGLLSKDYAIDLLASIDPVVATEKVSAGDPALYEGASTTHASIMDKDGNIVSLTQTIECFFGSGVVVPGTGILLNDQMHDFTVKPGTANSVEPGKKPLSSMSPTIVLKDGKPFMTIGSPGATRIITAVMQIISNVIDFGMGIQEAIEAPRIHCQGGAIMLEDRISEDIQAELAEFGHEIDVKGSYDLYFGGAQGVMFKDGKLHGGADPRRDGVAVGF